MEGRRYRDKGVWGWYLGDYVHHAPAEVTSVQWYNNGVEYGQGLIPSTLFFALADTVFGTTDSVVFYETIQTYAIAFWDKNCCKEIYHIILFYFAQVNGVIKMLKYYAFFTINFYRILCMQ